MVLLLDAQLPTRDLQVVGFESIPECKFSSLVVELTHPGELDHSLRDPPMGPCAMVNALDVPACMVGIGDPSGSSSGLDEEKAESLKVFVGDR
jgi:hypothetical protein